VNSSETGPHHDVFHFDLPPALIAQRPAAARTASRLLLADRQGAVRGAAHFADLPALLAPGDLLVLNDSRVLPARLRARRASGGAVELLLARPHGPASWLAMARPARRLKDGERLAVGDGVVRVLARRADGYLEIAAEGEDLCALAERTGETPLPPYIRRDGTTPAALRTEDRARYQTVYAEPGGSVAAPTAGLHFDMPLLASLAGCGVATARVTLHVGPGTFRTPTADDLRERRLHAERFVLPAETDAALRRTRAVGGRVIAVGTTALRVLETVRRLDLDRVDGAAHAWHDPADARPGFTGTAVRGPDGWRVEGLTRLFVMPPDPVPAADGLITNVHLPGSSLLMLVAAFMGGRWREVYDQAVRDAYRFYSFGDAVLVLPGAAEENP
jgi:S-adenosylmethionine:tRNA ribosyltransferase-isomerase